jgi:hypothetical protein
MDPNTPNQPSITGGAHSYYGNYLTSTVGLSLLLSLLLFISAGIGRWLMHPDNMEDAIIVLAAIVLFTIICGANSYYFCISGSYLEIRNHVFPWYLRVHHLDEIGSVQFRTGSFRRSDALRVKRKDDTSSGRYHAGSLRDKNWKALEKALQRRGISVDNRLHGTPAPQHV